MNEPFRLRYVNQIVGAFLLALFAFLFLLSVILIRSSDYFAKKNVYWIETDDPSAENLYRGAEIVMLGEPVGRVENLRYLDQSSKIRIDFSVDARYGPQMLKDSVAHVERKYGVGPPILVVRRDRAKPQTGPLPARSQITNFQAETDRFNEMGREVKEVSESIQAIEQSLQPTLKSIDNAARQLQTTLRESANPAFDKSGEAADEFSATNQAIRQRTKAVESRMSTMADNVEASTRDISAASDSIKNTSDEVRNDVLVQMVDAIERIKLLTEEVREVVRVVRSESNDLPGTTERFNDTVSETQDLVGEIRSHWLLRRYSKQPSSTPQVSPSAIRGGSGR